ncbi:MAG TPA: hypothetical protein VEH62_10610 [Gemmatimonadales bacterium]|nr:hypothetical protein [Gemmatimonadales bacterium]
MRPRHLLPVAGLALATACAEVTSVQPGPAVQYVTVRRAWQPGERDSTVAFVLRNHSLNVLGYDVSALAPDIFGGESVTVVVPSPSPQSAGPAGPARAVEFASGWSVVGVDLYIQNNNQTPRDTLSWLGVLWFNPNDSTWKGLTLAATPSATIPLTNVNTAAFDASGGKAGAGGGEAQQSTGTYWEASSGQMQITQNALCFINQTMTSGPWTGGSESICFFGGQLVNLTMPRKTGTTAPATQVFSLDFRNNLIFGVRLSCVYPSPCTSTGAPPARGSAGVRTVRETLTGR